MKRLHLSLPSIFLCLEGMTKIVSVTTMLKAKWTRHSNGQICVIFIGNLPSFFLIILSTHIKKAFLKYDAEANQFGF